MEFLEEQVVEVTDIGVELLRDRGIVDTELITYVHPLVSGLGDKPSVKTLVHRGDDRALRLSGKGVAFWQRETDSHLLCRDAGIFHWRQTFLFREGLGLQRRLGKGGDRDTTIADCALISHFMFLLCLGGEFVDTLLLSIMEGCQTLVAGGLCTTDHTVSR